MPADERPPQTDETGVSSVNAQAAPAPTLRYWAAAKAAAGVAEESLPAATVAGLLAAARDAHADDPRFARVLASCSLLLDERPLGTSDLAAVAVGPSSVVDVLPPFAGG